MAIGFFFLVLILLLKLGHTYVNELIFLLLLVHPTGSAHTISGVRRNRSVPTSCS